MKRIVSIIITVALLLSVSTAAFAESEAMQSALAKVKARIGNTDMYDRFAGEENDYNGR